MKSFDVQGIELEVPYATAFEFLADPAQWPRCRKRVDTAITLGRVDPDRLSFATSRERAGEFAEVLAEIRRLESLSRAAALYRSHPRAVASTNLVAWLKDLIRRADPRLGYWAGAS